MSAILSLRGVSKSYNDFHLDGVSFELPEGSIMGLIGENGAGKTTTIKLILNQIRRSSGEIKVFGLDAIEDEREIKEQLGVVLDESFFHLTLTANDVARIIGNIYKSFDGRVFGEYLDRLELPRRKRIKEYSRGMKMKLSIAAALSHNPRLLILDEATSGLDPIVRNQILDILCEFIQEESRGVLLSTHITSDLERIADYITYIHNGKVVFSERRDFLNDRYRIVSADIEDIGKIPGEYIVGMRKISFGSQALVKDYEEFKADIPDVSAACASLEEIMLFYKTREM
ncbi:MAG: ABC transporter ATP-binding protein [Clostridiales bacterium]|nr:ABC transporter ATP-binding protein [Clostridiales bacterium]